MPRLQLVRPPQELPHAHTMLYLPPHSCVPATCERVCTLGPMRPPAPPAAILHLHCAVDCLPRERELTPLRCARVPPCPPSLDAVYQKERHEFGRPVNTFGFSEVSILEEFVPEPELRSNHLERNPTILDVQAIPELSENYVNTDTVFNKSQGMVHHEGGWPKEVDYTEKEQTLRYKKKVEKDEEYIRQLRGCVEALQSDIMQNYSLDIYQEYFDNEEDVGNYGADAPSAKTLAVFKDPSEVSRQPSAATQPRPSRDQAVTWP